MHFWTVAARDFPGVAALAWVFQFISTFAIASQHELLARHHHTSTAADPRRAAELRVSLWCQAAVSLITEGAERHLLARDIDPSSRKVPIRTRPLYLVARKVGVHGSYPRRPSQADVAEILAQSK